MKSCLKILLISILAFSAVGPILPVLAFSVLAMLNNGGLAVFFLSMVGLYFVSVTIGLLMSVPIGAINGLLLFSCATVFRRLRFRITSVGVVVLGGVVGVTSVVIWYLAPLAWATPDAIPRLLKEYTDAPKMGAGIVVLMFLFVVPAAICGSLAAWFSRGRFDAASEGVTH